MNDTLPPIFCLNSSDSELQDKWIHFNFNENTYLINNIEANSVIDAPDNSQSFRINYDDLELGDFADILTHAFCYDPKTNNYFLFIINGEKNLYQFQYNTSTNRFLIAKKYNAASNIWNFASLYNAPLKISTFFTTTLPDLTFLSPELEASINQQFQYYQDAITPPQSQEITLWDTLKMEEPDFAGLNQQLGGNFPLDGYTQMILSTYIKTDWCMLKESSNSPEEYIKALLLVLSNDIENIQNHNLSENIYEFTLNLKGFLNPENFSNWAQTFENPPKVCDIYNYYIKAVCHEILNLEQYITRPDIETQAQENESGVISNSRQTFFTGTTSPEQNTVIYSLLNEADNNTINRLSRLLLNTTITVDEQPLEINEEIDIFLQSINENTNIVNFDALSVDDQILYIINSYIDVTPLDYDDVYSLIEELNRYQTDENEAPQILSVVADFIPQLIERNYPGFENLAATISQTYGDDPSFDTKLSHLNHWINLALNAQHTDIITTKIKDGQEVSIEDMRKIEYPDVLGYFLTGFTSEELNQYFNPDCRYNAHLQSAIENLVANNHLSELIKVFSYSESLISFVNHIHVDAFKNIDLLELFKDLQTDELSVLLALHQDLFKLLFDTYALDDEMINIIQDFINTPSLASKDKWYEVMEKFKIIDPYKLLAINLFLTDFFENKYEKYGELPEKIIQNFKPPYKELHELRYWTGITIFTDDVIALKKDIIDDLLDDPNKVAQINNPHLLGYFLKQFSDEELEEYFQSGTPYYLPLQEAITQHTQNSIGKLVDLVVVLASYPNYYNWIPLNTTLTTQQDNTPLSPENILRNVINFLHLLPLSIFEQLLPSKDIDTPIQLWFLINDLGQNITHVNDFIVILKHLEINKLNIFLQSTGYAYMYSNIFVEGKDDHNVSLLGTVLNSLNLEQKKTFFSQHTDDLVNKINANNLNDFLKTLNRESIEFILQDSHIIEVISEAMTKSKFSFINGVETSNIAILFANEKLQDCLPAITKQIKDFNDLAIFVKNIYVLDAHQVLYADHVNAVLSELIKTDNDIQEVINLLPEIHKPAFLKLPIFNDNPQLHPQKLIDALLSNPDSGAEEEKSSFSP